MIRLRTPGLIDVELEGTTANDAAKMSPYLVDGAFFVSIVEERIAPSGSERHASRNTKGSAPPAAMAARRSGLREDALELFARSPTVMFGVDEISAELDINDDNARSLLWKLKRDGLLGNPARGKYQHMTARKEGK